MEPWDDKPWDEMTEEERVEWSRQRGEKVSPEEFRAYLEGVASNPEGLAELERIFERLKAQKLAVPPSPAPGSGSVPSDPQPPS